MELYEIIDEKIVNLHLEAENKEQAIELLAKLLKDNDYVDDLDQFMKDIYEREAMGMTGIGEGIAIPHGKSDAVKKIGIAIGKTKQPIEWESLDGEKVQYIFLFSVSNDHEYAQNHMKLIAQFAGRLGNHQAVSKLLEVQDFTQLKGIFE